MKALADLPKACFVGVLAGHLIPGGLLQSKAITGQSDFPDVPMSSTSGFAFKPSGTCPLTLINDSNKVQGEDANCCLVQAGLTVNVYTTTAVKKGARLLLDYERMLSAVVETSAADDTNDDDDPKDDHKHDEPDAGDGNPFNPNTPINRIIPNNPNTPMAY